MKFNEFVEKLELNEASVADPKVIEKNVKTIEDILQTIMNGKYFLVSDDIEKLPENIQKLIGEISMTLEDMGSLNRSDYHEDVVVRNRLEKSITRTWEKIITATKKIKTLIVFEDEDEE